MNDMKFGRSLRSPFRFPAMKLVLVVVKSLRIPGFGERKFVVTDTDGEIMYAYATEQEAREVIKKWA